jgi:uncharacterized membrane protein YdcZ (DUF606 family)
MTNFRKAVIAAAMAAAIVGSQALAADISLAPGRPAGVHEAQRSPSLLLIGGAAAVAVVAVVIATQSSSNAGCGSACTTTTTTTTTS